MHRVLKPSGSLYLHCDQTAGHYLKIMLDFIFGGKAFCNDVVWSYRRWSGKAKKYQKMHDNILFYAKDASKHRWNWPMEAKADGTPKHKRWNERDPNTGKMVTHFTHYRDLPDRDDYPRANPRDPAVRSRLFGDQNGRCNGCRKRFDIENLETDHIVPRAKGGGSFFENFQLLCGRCNRIKGDRPMEYLLAVIAAMEEQNTIFGAPRGMRR